MGLQEHLAEAPAVDDYALQAVSPKWKSAVLLRCRWQVAFVAAALLVVCGHLVIKAGLSYAPALEPSAPMLMKIMHLAFQPTVLIGLGIYGLGTLCWMGAVAQTELSLLYPLTSLNYILICFLSAWLFQETISVRRGAGVAVIALGMVVLTRSQRRPS